MGGLSWGTDDNALFQAFSRFGNVLEAKVRTRNPVQNIQKALGHR